MADPIFVLGMGSRAYLNGTQLQFDESPYPFSANSFPSDTNYAGWEPITITAGYGSGPWVNNGPNGIPLNQEEHDGWIACEWFHGMNQPQLFQMIRGSIGRGPRRMMSRLLVRGFCCFRNIFRWCCGGWRA
jgi:hypothetical protein